MKASWEKIEKNQGVLEVEVDAEQVAAALDKAFKKIVKKVNVPGFRRGKVPRAIFEARFGVESLYQDAIDLLLPSAYADAVKQEGIEPVARPEVDIDEFGKGKPFKFKAKVLVKPEVTLGEYKGIEVEKTDSTVSDEELQEELTRLQNRHAELAVLEDGKIENGDIAVIDFAGSIDGTPFAGGKAENHSLEIGSGSFIPGFEEQLIGMGKGEEKEIAVTFPKDYRAEDLAGKDAVFKVKVNEIKRKNLPALDDEFAKDVSEFETLDEFKQDLKEKLAAAKERENRRKIEREVVEKAAGAATVEIPEVMFDTEVDHMLYEFEQRIRMQGMSLEMYFRYSGESEASLREQMREEAKKRVLNGLVLEAIAKAENITASDEDVDKELEKMTDLYKKTVDELRTAFAESGMLEDIRRDVVTRKTVEFLVKNSKNGQSAA